LAGGVEASLLDHVVSLMLPISLITFSSSTAVMIYVVCANKFKDPKKFRIKNGANYV
jgi:hypothetical protein